MAQSSSLPLPFQKSYGVNLALALSALIPFIVLTTSAQFYESQIITVNGASKVAIDIATWVGTAGYAFGALLGGDLIQRFPQRKLFLTCEGLFVAGTILVAVSTRAAEYGIGTVIQGFATGLLLVVALPPVIRRFPVERLTTTAAFIDIAFFGAIAIGPLLGGAIAYAGTWRQLYALIALTGAFVIGAAIFTLPHEDPPNPGRRFDWEGLALALVGTGLPFWAVGNLTRYGFDSPWFYLPFGVGLIAFLAMLLFEYHGKDPISPVKAMWNTIPIAGVLASMVGGGIYFTFYMLSQQYQVGYAGTLPLASGLSFWPQIIGVALAALLFRSVLSTRFLAVFTLVGMLALMTGGVILLRSAPDAGAVSSLVAFFALGFGAGATVAPGLWMAGLSLKSEMIGRIFALVELVRSEANFLMAPVLVKIAILIAGTSGTIATAGFDGAATVALAISAAITLAGLILWYGGRAELQRPDLPRWQKDDQPAWESPELFAPMRGVHPKQKLNKTARNS